MQLKKIAMDGTISGLAMGASLFIGGAILSRIVYGPQFAPPGKFEPEQINAFYFIWTKLLIGWLFGILFTSAYELLPLRMKFTGAIHGLKYGLGFWFLTSLWNLSHPIVYGSINVPDQIFWVSYQLIGFLALGAVLGYINKRRARKDVSISTS